MPLDRPPTRYSPLLFVLGDPLDAALWTVHLDVRAGNGRTRDIVSSPGDLPGILANHRTCNYQAETGYPTEGLHGSQSRCKMLIFLATGAMKRSIKEGVTPTTLKKGVQSGVSTDVTCTPRRRVSRK